MSNFHNKWKQYLEEAQQDAAVLRKINVKAIQKEMPQFPDEEMRDYFARIQGLEGNPEYLNPVFPTGLVSWMESLPDNHFPANGRKRFAKWLANAVYTQETDVNNNLDSVDNPEELRVYNNDIRYIVDYLNGAPEVPGNIWDMTFSQVFELSEEWHDTLASTKSQGDAILTKKVVHDFGNGFTIVSVPPEDLGTEGDIMGHCVGSYCDVVASGRVEIYSLRGPIRKKEARLDNPELHANKNFPCATIEVTFNRSYRTNKAIGQVDQIKGRGNAVPRPEYRPMIKQWLKTTDFEYINNGDYQAILGVEDFQAELEGDEFFENTNLANQGASHNDLEVVRYIIGRLEEIVAERGGNEYLDQMRTWGEEDDQRHLNNVIDNLSQNGHLELPEILRIAKVGFRAGIGTQIESMLSPGSQQRYLKYHGTEQNYIIARAVYEEMKDELFDSTPREWDDNERDSLLKQQVFFLSAIARQDPKARQEIVDFLLSPEMVQRQAATSRPTNNVYTTTFRHYLYTAGKEYRKVTKANDKFMSDVIVANPATVKGIFDFQNSEEGKKILPNTAPDQLLVAMADLPRLPREVINHFVEYTSTTSGVNNSKITNKVIASPEVDVEIKKKLIYNSYMKDDQHLPMKGYHYSSYAKIFARRLYEILPKVGEELAQWLVDNNLFEPLFVEKWKLSKVKRTGRHVDAAALNSEQIADLRSSVKRQRKNVQRQIKIRARKEKEKLQEQIQKYFGKNMMTKNKFYDNIKEQLNIAEEKGRSRQRGIYKFYCMIAYGLTAEGDKTRGLDDILADLRALPNVTIVTVAVRNQKVAEGRYIAGLAIKFIPSTPGDMNTPENVKARIVRDIKRLTNVQSLFKLSTGLIRLE